MAEVRVRSWEDPMPKGQRPRGVTPRPRSGAVAESARLRWRRNGREELPRVQGRGGGREEIPSVQDQGSNEKNYPTSEARGGRWEELSHPAKPKARGSGREEQPWRTNPTGTGGPRGTIPC